MKTYTIIGGVNGVGKSSFTGVLKERSTDLGIIIDVDKITAEMGVGALAGGKAALKKINECIDKGVSFTQETTLSGRKTETTAQKVKELGYHVRLFYIGLDTAAESLARIQNRVRRGGHDIPENDVERVRCIVVRSRVARVNGSRAIPPDSCMRQTDDFIMLLREAVRTALFAWI